MSHCIRNGVTYARHKYMLGTCTACGKEKNETPVQSTETVAESSESPELASWEGEGGAG